MLEWLERLPKFCTGSFAIKYLLQLLNLPSYLYQIEVLPQTNITGIDLLQSYMKRTTFLVKKATCVDEYDRRNRSLTKTMNLLITPAPSVSSNPISLEIVLMDVGAAYCPDPESAFTITMNDNTILSTQYQCMSLYEKWLHFLFF